MNSFLCLREAVEYLMGSSCISSGSPILFAFLVMYSDYRFTYICLLPVITWISISLGL